MAIGGKEFVLNFDNSPPYPPSYYLKIFIGSPDNNIKKECPVIAEMDTGNDFTLMPNHIIKELKLKVVKKMPLVGANGEDLSKEPIKFYGAKIIVKDLEEFHLLIGGVDFPPLIGRDMINRWHILFNLPNSTFEIATKKMYKLGAPKIN